MDDSKLYAQGTLQQRRNTRDIYALFDGSNQGKLVMQIADFDWDRRIDLKKSSCVEQRLFFTVIYTVYNDQSSCA